MEALLYWHWIVIGLILVALEMVLPGFILLWFGLAAIAIGALAFIFPSMAWEMQIFLFAVFSVSSIFIWKKMHKGSREDDPEETFLNQRGVNLIGRKTVLIEAIVDGVGKIKIDDTFWRVIGSDLPEGAHVEITDATGATLTVKAVTD
ncbi:MAG: NfeD family protein [Gammaproteobacteria bacterium]|nr:NfeD family protein [Gammaproteobacteria bacterium]NNJ73009.1 NfeD family protein [Enterobacterales bacterium]